MKEITLKELHNRTVEARHARCISRKQLTNPKRYSLEGLNTMMQVVEQQSDCMLYFPILLKSCIKICWLKSMVNTSMHSGQSDPLLLIIK